jgi:hypothetical protein
MQIAQFSVMAFPDDGSVPYEHSPHERVRADSPPPELRQLKRPPKVLTIRSCQ